MWTRCYTTKQENTVQALIKEKKDLLSENIEKPKEFWKIIKRFSLPDKKVPTRSICLNTKKRVDIFTKAKPKHF